MTDAKPSPLSGAEFAAMPSRDRAAHAAYALSFVAETVNAAEAVAARRARDGVHDIFAAMTVAKRLVRRVGVEVFGRGSALIWYFTLPDQDLFYIRHRRRHPLLPISLPTACVRRAPIRTVAGGAGARLRRTAAGGVEH